MSITVGDYSFDGPFSDPASLKDQSGVYVIHDCRQGKYYVIDVGETKEVQSRVSNHKRSSCWNEKSSGTLTYSGLYVNETERMKIEKQLREQYDPACGEF